jgi:hypothetical protein
MATARTIEQIRWNIGNGVSSHDDVVTLLKTYDQLLEDVKETNPILWKEYKRAEKKS